MNLSIKPLNPDLADDYFDFFENRAFSDRKGAFCYCTWFHFDCSIEKHYEQGREAMQKQAAVHIAKGTLNGYLAFIKSGYANGVIKCLSIPLKAISATRLSGTHDKMRDHLRELELVQRHLPKY